MNFVKIRAEVKAWLFEAKFLLCNIYFNLCKVFEGMIVRRHNSTTSKQVNLVT